MQEKSDSQVQDRARELRNKGINNIVLLLTTAFGLVAALAWNTAIQTAFTDFFGKASSLIAMFGYAVLVTIIAVVAITYISRLEVKEEKKE